MSNGSTTTYFVGGHYEVANGVVTKYYYAGSQRIALRTNGTLNYLLGDHLGSTSLTTDANGQVISEMRYKARGETRYASGITPTKYTYTGQYSYASDFGLHFYNARWYDSSLSRFAQADTIVVGGVQGYDRYAYVNNSPVRYTDPTGHYCEPGDKKPGGYCWSPASKPATPVVVIVGGTNGAGGPGPDPYDQMPAYQTNPFGFSQYPVQCNQTCINSKSSFAYELDRDENIPDDQPVLFVCYSGSAPSCLMAAVLRIDQGQQVAGVLYWARA